MSILLRHFCTTVSGYIVDDDDNGDARRKEKQKFYQAHNVFLRVTLFFKRMFYESHVYYNVWYTRVHEDDDPSLCLGLYTHYKVLISQHATVNALKR